MVIALAGLGLLLGFVLGWLAHRQVSLHYRERWLQAIGLLNAKALEVPDDANVVVPLPVSTKPYIAGKWSLDERHENNTAFFFAIRTGFDDVELGSTMNFQRYKGLYQVTRSNAEQAVADMNRR